MPDAQSEPASFSTSDHPAPQDHPLLQSPEARIILAEVERRYGGEPASLPMHLLTAEDSPAPVAPVVPGLKTTEFWVSVISILGVFGLVFANKLDAGTALLVIASIVPGYAISRGLTKRGAGGAVGAVALGAALLLPLSVLSGCANTQSAVAQAGADYRHAVAAQSFTANVDGRAQTVGVGTTIYFRDPAQGLLPAATPAAK